jgi:hypothetical protein
MIDSIYFVVSAFSNAECGLKSEILAYLAAS